MRISLWICFAIVSCCYIYSRICSESIVSVFFQVNQVRFLPALRSVFAASSGGSGRSALVEGTARLFSGEKEKY